MGVRLWRQGRDGIRMTVCGLFSLCALVSASLKWECYAHIGFYVDEKNKDIQKREAQYLASSAQGMLAAVIRRQQTRTTFISGDGKLSLDFFSRV